MIVDINFSQESINQLNELLNDNSQYLWMAIETSRKLLERKNYPPFGHANTEAKRLHKQSQTAISKLSKSKLVIESMIQSQAQSLCEIDDMQLDVEHYLEKATEEVNLSIQTINSHLSHDYLPIKLLSKTDILKLFIPHIIGLPLDAKSEAAKVIFKNSREVKILNIIYKEAGLSSEPEAALAALLRLYDLK